MKRVNISRKLAKKLTIAITSLLLGIGAGVGIGFGAFNNRETSFANQTNQLRNWAFSGIEISEPTLAQAQIETYDETANKYPTILISDGNGDLNDQSFYENAGKGLLDIYGLREGPSNSDKKLSDFPKLYIEPLEGANGTKDIQTLYSSVQNKIGVEGKKIAIAPGFGHVEAICEFQKDVKTDKTIQFLLIDNSYECNDTNDSALNVHSITFNVKEASFKAGYLAALFLNKTNDDTPTIGFWGGGPFDSIDSFLVGFVSGIKYFNDNNGNDQDVKFSKFSSEEEYRNSGFEAGNGRAKADYLVSSNTDIILPVAGGQTKDLIDSINAAKKQDDIKIIGVDADARVPYSIDKRLFLTSITKNLQKAVYQGYKCLTMGTWDISNETDCQNQLKSGFEGNIENGFSNYVKQFSSIEGEQSLFWKNIYEKVDSIEAKVNLLSNWEQAYNYILLN